MQPDDQGVCDIWVIVAGNVNPILVVFGGVGPLEQAGFELFLLFLFVILAVVLLFLFLFVLGGVLFLVLLFLFFRRRLGRGGDGLTLRRGVLLRRRLRPSIE